MDAETGTSSPGRLDLERSPGFADLTPLFILLAGAVAVGSILHHKDIAYGVNDGSRWDTVYYLVEHGTYEFLPDHGAAWGQRPIEAPRDIPPFGTVDMICIPDAHGQAHYYASKPPFVSTFVAGVVRLIELLSLGRVDFRLHPRFVVRTTLVLVQVLPLLVAFWLLRRHMRRCDESPFLHAFCLAGVTLGTYLTAWAVTLNNHVMAAAAAAFAAHAMIRIWYDGRRGWSWFALAGFWSAFAAACELPAGLLAAACMILMLCKDWRRTLAAAVPAALVPTAVFIGTNYLVTGRILPAYTEVYKPGGWYDFPGSYWSHPTGIDALHEPKSMYLLNMLVGHHGFFSLTPVLVLCLTGLLRELFGPAPGRRGLAGLTLALTAAVAGVYASATSNYGGLCEGFRWLFWLVPLWLLFLAAGASMLAGRRLGRGICYASLAISVVSMADALARPWSPSWLHRLFQQVGWSAC